MRTLTSLLTLIFLSGCASVSITAYREDKTLAPSHSPTKITVAITKAVFAENCERGKAFAHGRLEETLYLEPETGHAFSRESAPKTLPSGKVLSEATNKQIQRFLPKGGYQQALFIDSRITSHQKGPVQ